MPELIRSFVAVKLPGDMADKLENFLADLRPLSPIRWVRRSQFHITLKFLGENSREVTEDVKEALTPLKHFEPFTVRLSYIGAFPNLNAPKVLWLSGDEGASELGRLSRLVNDALLEGAGLERDTRKFKAHLTLARLKDATLPEELVRRLGEVPVLSWRCSELVLMRSVLTPSGPVYSELL
ncbi:MAG: RNA 2',3'-cyclic phosphodiesterase [Synergistaceae bacterium]|nr:RNA 2',3'-cyclic phosphodiesterase [Synergistaceae bacterium]